MEIKETEYKGHPLLEFKEGETYPIKLGIKKIKCVLNNIEKCKEFVEKHKKV